MKKTLAIAGVLALTVTLKPSFSGHLKPKISEIKVDGELSHTT